MWQVRASRPDSCQSHSECRGAARESGVTGGGLTALTGGEAGTVGERTRTHPPEESGEHTHTCLGGSIAMATGD